MRSGFAEPQTSEIIRDVHQVPGIPLWLDDPHSGLQLSHPIDNSLKRNCALRTTEPWATSAVRPAPQLAILPIKNASGQENECLHADQGRTVFFVVHAARFQKAKRLLTMKYRQLGHPIRAPDGFFVVGNQGADAVVVPPHAAS